MPEHDVTRYDPLDELLDAVDRDQQTWTHETVGDKVAGTVVELGEVEGDYGTSPVVVVVTKDGDEVRILGYGTVLRNQIERAHLEVGDLFAVRYVGMRENNMGKPYRDFRTVVRKAVQPVAPRPAEPVVSYDDDLLADRPGSIPLLPGEELF